MKYAKVIDTGNPSLLPQLGTVVIEDTDTGTKMQKTARFAFLHITSLGNEFALAIEGAGIFWSYDGGMHKSMPFFCDGEKTIEELQDMVTAAHPLGTNHD